ncbi:MAG: ABC transporter permease [Verrucomicrobia bacterium]|nr:ABC transporter permease [Verrucomicrobiota bacterium]
MNDLRFAFRQFLRNPGFTLVAVSSLAIGLALAACTLATVNAYLLRSVPYPTAQRVFHLRYAPVGPWEPRGMTAIDWKSLSDVVEDSITSSGVAFHLNDAGSLTRARGLQASSGFVRGLGVQPVIGRTFVEEEFQSGAEAVAMISHALWRDRFGSDPQIAGRQLSVMRGEEAEQPQMLRVVGVLPPGFWFGRDSGATVDILTPLHSVMRTYMVRLREDVPVALAEKRITEAARSVGSDFRPDWTGVHLESVQQRYVENIRPVLVGISIAVGVVLVLVCANLAVLLLLRAMRRQKEVAVRVALGAEQKHLLRMVAAEAGLICVAAFAAGLVLTGTALRVLTPLFEAQLGRPAPGGPGMIQIDPTVLIALGGVTLLIALSLAFIPLLAPWRYQVADTLRSQGTTTTDGPFMRRLRRAL